MLRADPHSTHPSALKAWFKRGSNSVLGVARTNVLSRREIRRCLKRHLARRLFKLLERTATEHPQAVAVQADARPAPETRA